MGGGGGGGIAVIQQGGGGGGAGGNSGYAGKIRLEYSTLNGAEYPDTTNENSSALPDPASSGQVQVVQGGTATVVSTTISISTAPSQAMAVWEGTINGGSIEVYVSRDDGVNWSGSVTNGLFADISTLQALPSGAKMRLKAVLKGNSRLKGWALTWY